MLSWRAARRMSGFTVASIVVLGALSPAPAQADGTEVTGGAPGAVAPPAAPAAPATVTQSKIPTSAPAEREPAPEAADAEHPGADTVVAELTEKDLKPFSMLGVTWDSGLDEATTRVEARWTHDGQWSAWTDMHADPAPDEEGKPGTEPQWVGEADGAQVRVISTKDAAPKGLALSTIDPDVSESDADSGTAVSPAIDVTQTATVAKPAIISRASWGANNSGSCDSPIYGGTTRGAVIHHTAGTNTYTKSQSAAIVKATQAYHMKSRKWCDIGYNFLVDKYGQIFEGRAGGVTKPVRAAHSGNLAVNEETMGVSLMGTFSTTAPSDAMKTATVNLVAWRFAQYKLKAKGTYSLGGKTLNRIAGHRNVVSTECPGAAAYAWLSAKGGLRDRVEDRLASGGVTAEVAGRTTSAVTSSGFTLGWNAFSKAATYQVRNSTSSTAPTTCSTSCRTVKATTAPQLTLSGLAAGSTQYVWVRAIDASGKALTAWQVVPKTVKLEAAPVKKPGAIAGLKVVAGASSASVSWSAASDATSYDYCLVTDTAATKCVKARVGLPATAVKFFQLTATSATDYYVKVRSARGSVKGAWSAFRGFNLKTSTSTTPAGDAVSVPSSRTVTVKGHGYGHGIGMSQYGAQNAAIKGVKYDKILSTYYPGTKLGTKTGTIRVLVSQDTTDSVVVSGASGLKFRKLSGGSSLSLPTSVSGKTVTRWQIVQVAGKKTQSALQYKTSGGYFTYKDTRWTGDAQFEGPSTITLRMPDDSGVRYRGAVRSALPSSGSTARNTVNVLSIDDYVRGVVAAEMPSSWRSEALKAQSVAARTYGVRSITSSRYYDICSTTACQVYGGASRETAATDAAVAATRGKIVTYAGKPAFTQFSSSSGGFTATGSQPYLKAVSDPYDDWSGNANHDWSQAVKASTIEKAYPSIGALKQLRVTKRTGHGDLGGRVSSVSLVGSKKTVTISGDDARWAFGLKSNWFRF